MKKLILVIVVSLIAGLTPVLWLHSYFVSATPLAAPVIVDIYPNANSHDNSQNTSITALFDQEIISSTINTQTFLVHASQTSFPTLIYDTDGSIARMNPTKPFKFGEEIQVVATSDIHNISGQGAITPTVWEFRVATDQSSGIFAPTTRTFGSTGAEFDLGDLNNDGYIDIFLVDQDDNVQGEIWLNDGQGYFTTTGQTLGLYASYDVALGDVDNDGDLDAVIANYGVYDVGCACMLNTGNQIWLNNGNGYFVDSGQALGDDTTKAIGLGDLDGDGDLDLYFANSKSRTFQTDKDEIWINDGSGIFTDSGQLLDGGGSMGVALGDMDNDGDLDAFVANSDGNKYWLNAGNGIFVDSGQAFTTQECYAVDLGDLDNDRDLDVFVTTSWGRADEIWLNDGNGYLSRDGQNLGNDWGSSAELGDIDGDGDLDAFVATNDMGGGNFERVWLNNGSGIFHLSNQPLFEITMSGDVGLGDVDNDGDLDAIVGSDPIKVWINQEQINFIFMPVCSMNYCPDFFDDFSQTSSGWPRIDSADVSADYLNGEYSIQVKNPGYIYMFAAPSCERENYEVVVDGRWQGTPGSSYGLIFGLAEDFTEYYLYDINTDYQQYRLYQFSNDQFYEIIAPTYNSAIRPGNETNQIKVVHLGNELGLYVNGSQVNSFYNSVILKGEVGILSGSYSDQSFSDARFDNFSFIQLDESISASLANLFGRLMVNLQAIKRIPIPFEDLTSWEKVIRE